MKLCVLESTIAWWRLLVFKITLNKVWHSLSMKGFCKGNKNMLALLPYLVLALEAVLELDTVSSLSFSHVVHLNGFGCLTNQTKYPLHFSMVTEKIFHKMSCFSFIKAAVIKQEHVISLCRGLRTRCFLHEDICLRSAATLAKLSGYCLKACS